MLSLLLVSLVKCLFFEGCLTLSAAWSKSTKTLKTAIKSQVPSDTVTLILVEFILIPEVIILFTATLGRRLFKICFQTVVTFWLYAMKSSCMIAIGIGMMVYLDVHVGGSRLSLIHHPAVVNCVNV